MDNGLFTDIREELGSAHVHNVNVLMKIANGIHLKKEQVYDRSFAKRGLAGVWFNLTRKADVIDNSGSKSDFESVEFVDALMDVAVYALKFIDVLRVIRPDIFDRWVDVVVRKYLEEDEIENYLVSFIDE
jgi:hypothetical protein